MYLKHHHFGAGIAAALVVSLTLVSQAGASAIVPVEFTFTGADLMNYATVDGADDSSPADNNLFDGARSVNDTWGTGAYAGGEARSYWESENADFVNWASNTDDRLLGFNLWAKGDAASQAFGEDIKVLDWEVISTPTGWDHLYYGDGNPGWDAWTGAGFSFDEGLHFDDVDLADIKFTFVGWVDLEDPHWQETPGSPNNMDPTAGPIVETFSFGGHMASGESGEVLQFDTSTWYGYSGNMVLEGQIVPTPTAALAGFTAFGMLGLRRPRRKAVEPVTA